MEGETSTKTLQNKSHATLRKKLGEAAYRAYMADIGARGGKKKVKKGFAVTGLQYRHPRKSSTKG